MTKHQRTMLDNSKSRWSIMPTFRVSRSLVYVAALLGLSFSNTLVQANPLIEKSPFLPPGHGSQKPEPTQNKIQAQGPISREIEFRGIVSMGGTDQFSIFNKKAQKGYWISSGESVEGIRVRGYDSNNGTIVVSMNGRSERLSLMTATEKPLPVASSSVAPSAPPQARPPTLPPNMKPPENENKRRVIPRRRVILPNQSN